MIVIADTSGLLAALDDGHPDGPAARRALDEAGTVIVSPVLLSELDHVARRVLGRDAAHQAIDDLARGARAGRVVLAQITHEGLRTAQAVRLRYAGLRLDLADAVIVVLAADYNTDAVLTLDRRDFRAIAPLTHHQSFRLLPDDA